MQVHEYLTTSSLSLKEWMEISEGTDSLSTVLQCYYLDGRVFGENPSFLKLDLCFNFVRRLVIHEKAIGQ